LLIVPVVSTLCLLGFLFVCLSVCLFVFVCLFACLFVSHTCLSLSERWFWVAQTKVVKDLSELELTSESTLVSTGLTNVLGVRDFLANRNRKSK
jgi:hypothetical protein